MLDLKTDQAKNGDSASNAKSKAKEDEVEITGPMRLKKSEIVLFTEELSELLGAGLQLEPALRVMENREELGKLKRLTKSLRQEVRDGTAFSVALAKASPSFGDLYCSLARAGEVSGALSTILKRQATYLTAIQELQSKVLMALIYPFFLIASGIAVVVLFITFLIPQLMGLLDNTNSEMPAIGQLMIDLSDFIRAWWWIILGGVIAVIFGFISYIKNPNNHEWWDETKLKIPLFGKVLKTRFFVQFLETLANLVGNGLTLLRALELSREATPNLYLKKIISRIIEYVGDGAALSRTMKRVGFFPPLLLDMVAVGEQTGHIGESLERAANRYDRELEKDIAKISALIQPVIVVTMAFLVGIMAYMMISVIFDTISGLNT
ncbi:MAG: type II secretion system F family protein, partial [Verrucomicrobiota bacterium]|nr:type II secretion system F family protein [Verrucomicrobiota bacterium]